MKKKNLKSLKMNKKTISSLTYHQIKGGETQNFSCDPNPSSFPLNCEPTPSEVSLCTITKLPNCPVSRF